VTVYFVLLWTICSKYIILSRLFCDHSTLAGLLMTCDTVWRNWYQSSVVELQTWLRGRRFESHTLHSWDVPCHAALTYVPLSPSSIIWY